MVDLAGDELQAECLTDSLSVSKAVVNETVSWVDVELGGVELDVAQCLDGRRSSNPNGGRQVVTAGSGSRY